MPTPEVEVGSKSEEYMWTGVGLYDRSDHTVTDCRLHPLIHTIPPRTLAQDGGPGREGAEFILKYVISSFKQKAESVLTLPPQVLDN